MTWLKFDEDFTENPKIAQASDSAFALWVAGIAYCNRNLTDGFIPSMVGLGQLRWCDGNTVPVIRELEDRVMWEKVTGGWQVHDYLDFQPSREKVLAERAKKQAAGQAGGRASAQARAQADGQAPAQAESNPVSVSVPVPEPQDQNLDQPRRKIRAAPSEENAVRELIEGIGADPDTPRPAPGLSQVQDELRHGLVELDPVWESLSFGGINLLNKRYGRPVVVAALQRARSEKAKPTEPYPWLNAICRDIEERAEAVAR